LHGGGEAAGAAQDRRGGARKRGYPSQRLSPPAIVCQCRGFKAPRGRGQGGGFRHLEWWARSERAACRHGAAAAATAAEGAAAAAAAGRTGDAEAQEAAGESAGSTGEVAA